MTAEEILAELKAMGNETTRRTLLNHGAPSTLLGVKIEDLKKIQKKVKKNHELALRLYDSGISDAQYLAGLIADETKMGKKELEHWVNGASWYMLSEYTVPGIASESAHGWELGLEWIDSPREITQTSGWTTLANYVSLKPDEDLDLDQLKRLLHSVENEIHSAGNRVRYAMNTFVISVGGYVKALTAEAQRVAKANGKLSVNMGGTACKVPYAPDYIQKMLDRGVKKKKMARC